MSTCDSSSGSRPTYAGGSDAELLQPKLEDELLDAKLDAEYVEKFMGLLAHCNVHTRGSLRLFAGEITKIVDMMFDKDSMFGALQARGFLAAVRVYRAQTPVPPEPCPNSEPHSFVPPRADLPVVHKGCGVFAGADRTWCSAIAFIKVSESSIIEFKDRTFGIFRYTNYT